MSREHGQCLCGAVRFVAQIAHQHHDACHCSICRRWGSAPYFSCHATSIEFEGEPDIQVYSSSVMAERAFCRQCSSHIFYRQKNASAYALNVGLLSNSHKFKLTEEIFVDNKPDGYEFTGDHPRLTEAEYRARLNKICTE